ncbi:polyketide cyclase [Microbulbifer flavimaris]|uniref:Polyketide cyclase n=1 Tax=Microbulbifer flavimaris TaxID=1781068 RepID=A0ABX4I2C0_9GAMM|nr:MULTISPECIES: ester cyclase [Microbulbifer]KUJ84479.1 polyketide cyclase [Microbulbifer sp. ZGT114]PCO06567.1 polyketide cyclase [Microbulbifer flavimaris]
MPTNIHTHNKALLAPLRAALYDYEPREVRKQLDALLTMDALVQLAYPFETLSGPAELFERALSPLAQSIPDLERRDTIVMAGQTPAGADWVGCCGYYTGSFEKPWLDIPATGHQVAMRFHEFYRFENGRVIEVQALWDIPEVMMQAKAWPMTPSLGREWHVPGPATQDGLAIDSKDTARAARSQKLVHSMCDALGNYATGGVEAMQLDKYWHPRCSWYGPSGIGTGRGIQGFRNWHQIPFLNGLPDRVGDAGEGHIFADGDYVGFTAWPGMQMSVSGDGWLGIAPSGREITMRSLDFWRCENGMIRENWVLVDLLDVYHQLGVDVFARLREFNKARR